MAHMVFVVEVLVSEMGAQKCSGTKDSMIKMSKTFVCRSCTDQSPRMDRTSMDIGDGASLELVDKFCYLGDMLSVDGDDETAVEARARKGWNKFRQIVPLLTTKDVLWERNYTNCVWCVVVCYMAVKRGQ